jgi:hypothetical protein
MLRIPRRLPYEILIGACILLGSCDGPGLSQKQRDEVDDIAEASVSGSDAMVAVRDRLDAIEQKLEAQ